jgi:hypothetical protein
VHVNKRRRRNEITRETSREVKQRGEVVSNSVFFFPSSPRKKGHRKASALPPNYRPVAVSLCRYTVTAFAGCKSSNAPPPFQCKCNCLTQCMLPKQEDSKTPSNSKRSIRVMTIRSQCGCFVSGVCAHRLQILVVCLVISSSSDSLSNAHRKRTRCRAL